MYILLHYYFIITLQAGVSLCRMHLHARPALDLLSLRRQQGERSD